MKLIAERQLNGSYGNVAQGMPFEAGDDVARELIDRRLARVDGMPNACHPQDVDMRRGGSILESS